MMKTGININKSKTLSDPLTKLIRRSNEIGMIKLNNIEAGWHGFKSHWVY